ncbi:hypothetical protein DPEC_G00170500 [Dallia pectoralis]|uniref:Uncharacterized protein n=1 Tax=Dallia pectoralis TaxID=75939 RepID=A0ACC2GDF8_DALPE|nr:hypothetical protein DPEC_G00170500 [Dallia pectoralis]
MHFMSGGRCDKHVLPKWEAHLGPGHIARDLHGKTLNEAVEMARSLVLVLLLSLIGCGCSQDDSNPGRSPPPPRGCGANVDPLYRALCDLESVWAVVLEAVACGGAITSLVLFVVLLVKRCSILEPDRRSGLGPLLLLLISLLALFSLSLAFLLGRTEALCMVRRLLWGPLFALCFSCLLAQAVRLKRLASGKSSPRGSTLAGLGAALALVQGIVSGEWLLLSVAREGHGACDYPPLDFALVCSYALGLLLAAFCLSLGVMLCGGGDGGDEEGSDGGRDRRWRCNAVWLFLACLASLLLWAAWLALYLHGDAALRRARSGGGGGRRQDWDEPVSAVALVAQGWVLLLFHAIPEAHLCLRDPPAPSQHDYFDTSQPPPPCFPQDVTLTRGPYTENQAYSIEEHSAALRDGSFHNSGIRPGIPFRGHMYQPTEMALVMNGGAIPTVPVNYTGLKTASIDEVVFVSETNGCNFAANIFIDQAQRLALQKEIDQESPPSVSVRSLMVRAGTDVKKIVSMKKNGMGKKMEHTVANASINEGSEKVVKKKKKINAETMAENQTDSNVDVENTVEDENMEGSEYRPSGPLIQKKKKKNKKATEVKQVKEEEEMEQCDVEERGRAKKKKHCDKSEEIEQGEKDEIKKATKKIGKKTVAETKVGKKRVKNNNISMDAEPTVDIQEEEVGEIPKKRKKTESKTKVKTKMEPENGEAEMKMVVKKEKKRVALDNEEVQKEVVKTKKRVATDNEKQKDMVLKNKEKKVKVGVDKATSTVKVEEMVDKDDKKTRAKSNCTDPETGGKEEVSGRKKGGMKEKRKASASTEDVVGVEEGKPKKKKKVHPKEGEERADDGESEGTVSVAAGKKAKKGLKKGSEVKAQMERTQLKKKSKRGEMPEKEKRKRKIKVERCDPEDQETKPQKDVVFLSETKGNKDEITINQARRVALQKEIDVESNPGQPKVATGLGQWGTAQFDSSDQQNKFLRLMGGFKKGGQPMGASAAPAGRANMALTKDGQQSLQQKLLGEFERAQSRRMDFTGRGAGIGFSAPSNKKFSIDINATRSVRFDD